MTHQIFGMATSLLAIVPTILARNREPLLIGMASWRWVCHGV